MTITETGTPMFLAIHREWRDITQANQTVARSPTCWPRGLMIIWSTGCSWSLLPSQKLCIETGSGSTQVLLLLTGYSTSLKKKKKKTGQQPSPSEGNSQEKPELRRRQQAAWLWIPAENKLFKRWGAVWRNHRVSEVSLQNHQWIMSRYKRS